MIMNFRWPILSRAAFTDTDKRWSFLIITWDCFDACGSAFISVHITWTGKSSNIITFHSSIQCRYNQRKPPLFRPPCTLSSSTTVCVWLSHDASANLPVSKICRIFHNSTCRERLEIPSSEISTLAGSSSWKLNRFLNSVHVYIIARLNEDDNGLPSRNMVSTFGNPRVKTSMKLGILPRSFPKSYCLDYYYFFLNWQKFCFQVITYFVHFDVFSFVKPHPVPSFSK